MHGCMRSDLRLIGRGFTILETVLVVAIICLMILALLPAFRREDDEPHYQLQPRPTPVATPTPEPTLMPPPTPFPVSAAPKPNLR